MSQIGVFIPCHGAEGAACVKQSIEAAHCYTGLRVVKLRDRTGPSVAARLAKLEEHARRFDLNRHHARLAAVQAALGESVCVGCGGNVGHHKAPDGGGCSGWFPTVREHLARLETEHAALVVRVGELERLPVASEDVSPISEAAINGPPEWCRDLVPPTEEPAPVRPEPGSVAWQRVKAIQAIDDGERTAAATREQIESYLRSRPDQWREGDEQGLWLCEDEGYYLGAASDRAALVKRLGLATRSTTAEDPDRLAKVAPEPTDDELGQRTQSEYWGSKWDHDRWVGLTATRRADYTRAGKALYSLGREHGERERTAILDARAKDRAALLARAEKAEKAERQLARWVQEACDVGEALKPYRVVPGAAFLSRADDIRDLVADWQKRGEELEALRAKPTAPDVTRDPLSDAPVRYVLVAACHEPLRAASVFCADLQAESMPAALVIADGHIAGLRQRYHDVGSAKVLSVVGEVAIDVNGARPSAPTPIAHVPTESAGADGARLVPSEQEMAAKLREAGWQHSSSLGWHHPPSGGASFTLAGARAASKAYGMRAAKGAR